MIRARTSNSGQIVHSHAHRSRSAGVSFGRFYRALQDSDLMTSARISNWRAARLRNDAASETISGLNKRLSGNRRMSDKLQFINLIGIYGRHRAVAAETSLYPRGSDDHASAVDVADLQRSHLRPAQSSAIQSRQQSTVFQVGCDIDQLLDFLLTENPRQLSSDLRFGDLQVKPWSPQCLVE